MKSMREMISLMEGVMAVPGLASNGQGGAGGAEADMQTIGTNGRDQAYSNFDASQQPASEGVDLDEKSHSEKQARFMAACAHGADYDSCPPKNVAKEFNKADKGTKQLSNAMKEGDYNLEEKAPPGMEDMVMKLKKEYPGHHEKAFATAWSIYNKKHGKKEEACSMEESVPAVDSCQQSNPANADVACAMESGVSDLIYDQQYSRFANLMKSYVDPQKAFDVISREMAEQGIEGEEHDDIIQRLENDFFPDDSGFDMANGLDDREALASAGRGSDEDYGYFGDNEIDEGRPGDIDPSEINAMISLPHQEAKARAQEILAASTTGDVKKQYLARQIENTRNTMGVIKLLYDMVLKGEGHGVQGSSYSKKFDKPMEEAYDLQNGYHDIDVADAQDYFPDGADSPVTDKTGPSGARQGDNPEQKKMQIAEVHKELVYSYRDFLKESINSGTKKKS